MNIFEIKRTMLDKGIPKETMEQFDFPENEEETPEDKIAFVNQMDSLLSKEQILSIMEEQGCNKKEPTAEFMLKFRDKPLEERMNIINAMSLYEQPHCRINDDETLSIFWDNYVKDGKYQCVCPMMSELSKSEAVSITFCGCCSGHVKFHFENFLGVKLRLVETVSSPISSNGEKYCEHRFEII